jgi:AcrR family transcriptional regulator
LSASAEPLATPSPRPLRADAARNRERVLAAAREAFAECGRDAQMEDVARRAGVGVGTVYRHFATKEALVDALVEARFRQAMERAREALALEDPWEAVVSAFRATAELQARDRCFADAASERIQAVKREAPVYPALQEVWARLLARAREAGVLRPDFGIDDLPMIMCGLANVVAQAESRGAWERYLAIVLDGLRSSTPSALPAA